MKACSESLKMSIRFSHPTLNGRPADISGLARPFARVSIPATGISIAVDWATVKRVIREEGGKFNTELHQMKGPRPPLTIPREWVGAVLPAGARISPDGRSITLV